jgi:hypothetical protein
MLNRIETIASTTALSRGIDINWEDYGVLFPVFAAAVADARRREQIATSAQAILQDSESRAVLDAAAGEVRKQHRGNWTPQRRLLAAASVLLAAGVVLPVAAPTAGAAETAYTNLMAALAVILALAALLRPPDDHR